MNRIRIIAVGKVKETYLLQALQEYEKRLRPYLKLEFEEVGDLPCPEKASPAQEEQVLKQEGELIQGRLNPKDYLVVLDRQGQEMTSIEFADFLNQRISFGETVTFVIGGSLGLTKNIIQRAQLKLSFSRLTFPHQLFRVILLEQIYRAVKINRGEKYHK
ncbi:MAG TPA: 23S rRNA (pseudouridine(1915)-N(3))-methyltransferase RlmH [Bacillota bacterium]|nr:23S rRNA (pseudouridine(1915)-N(3))-methyltransferase RlmH [Bacillota bacterium]